MLHAAMVMQVFGRVLAVYQQALLQMLVLVSMVAVSAGLQPNRYELVARMEFMSHCVLIATLALGLMFDKSLNALRHGDAVSKP